MQASHDFAEIRKHGTGKSSVLAQHFIVSFKPGEITPERALQLGQEICEQFLKGEYQYFMTCHIDKNHTHLHVVFNNTNCIDGRTFETHENRRTTKQDRSFQKLMNITDEICRRHHLSVIDHPERNKGKSYWEWDMSRQGLSWKTKLKYAIDQVVKVSDNFEDFLEKCAEYGILVEYNPEHKIDLKFMLAEQKENNPRAKFTRAKTLGWYYETAQIRDRIAQYKGVMAYVPRTKIKVISKKPQNKFVQDAIDRGNMKVASIAKNIIAKYGIEPENLDSEIQKLFAQRDTLSDEISALKEHIQDLIELRKTLATYRKQKPVYDELESLKGRKRKKYQDAHYDELRDYYSAEQKLDDWFEKGKYPPDSKVKEAIISYQEQLSQKQAEHDAVHAKYVELRQAQRDINIYLQQYAPQAQRQEQQHQQEQQKKKKRNVLE